MLPFSVEAVDPHSKARAGWFETSRGRVETPAFMPVGTTGTVKAISQRHLKETIDAPIILGNTYHLYLRPGEELLEKAGGLHRLMSWERPILTDSGGFQVYSLSELRKIRDDGVEFRSHLDGSKHLFTPRRVIEIQRRIGSDIMMPLDECAAYPTDYDYAERSTRLTSEWAALNKEAFERTEPLYGAEQFLFGIIQGSVYEELRERSARDLREIGFDGYAIGGLAVGEPTDEMYRLTDFTTDLMPEDRPRYLMGVGRPENLLEAVERGVDMFDCVMPTRNARNAYLFTSEGVTPMRTLQFRDDFRPLDEHCDCETCRTYSRAYLRHLFVSKELLAFELASVHNLRFYVSLMSEARRRIVAGDFSDWKKETIAKLTYHH
ncbi:MAG: tRNA guanosine(34) transglycosylase Tgt [Ignavibacteriales bacterium]|nr:tRNA guanosine(34) transglycosylase Tgt [Ignavibacteriales bacterium]